MTLPSRAIAPLLFAATIGLTGCAAIPGTASATNGKEAALPDLQLRTAEHWRSTRRAQIHSLFEAHVYGAVPTGLGAPAFHVLATRRDALDGLATRRLVRITLPRYPAWQGIDVLLYVPNDTAQPAPCFVGLSFAGNHAVSTDLDVPISARWMRATNDGTVVDNRATETSRGSESSRWPLAKILESGFAVATAYYGDIEPDHPEGWRDGLRGVTSTRGTATVWQNGEWGAIAAWAYGLHLIADYLQRERLVDGGRLAVIGHSRLGKTALWAGAEDERFAVVVSNDSGEGGAALMRRPVGETTANITSSFPHWFTATYANYASDPSRCPVDQHMLVALMAPRAVYIGSAIEDTWADPEGEFLSGLHASPVYTLLGVEGMTAARWPAVDTPVGGRIGYHVRTGGHDLTDYDWERYIAFVRSQDR